MSIRYSDRRCPECGAALLEDGRVEWCSLVSDAERKCDYGLNGSRNVPRDRGAAGDERGARPVATTKETT